MFFKKLFMDNTGSLSYLIGCTETKTACVVDPKRGVHEYIHAAMAHGMKITHIFDTRSHARNLKVNMELKLRTGAEIYYLNSPELATHQVVKEGDEFRFGSALVKVINSPCHNPFGNSILVADISSNTEPWMILHPDSLFIGDLDRRSNLTGDALSGAVSHYLDQHEHHYGGIPGNPGYGKYGDMDLNHQYAM
ncbi:MAG: hypothetical protein ACOZF0_03255 [Thermodesulfobacteriota bacterium]